MAAELETAPAPAALKGLAEWWDNRLAWPEKRALWHLTDFRVPSLNGPERWDSLVPAQRAALLMAFQRAVQLGIECALALDWKGTKGTGLDAEDEFRTLK